jgi:hypothetical protein
MAAGAPIITAAITAIMGAAFGANVVWPASAHLRQVHPARCKGGTMHVSGCCGHHIGGGADEGTRTTVGLPGSGLSYCSPLRPFQANRSAGGRSLILGAAITLGPVAFCLAFSL